MGNDYHRSRRDVLRAGAGLAGVSAMAGLAGCSNVPVVGQVLGGSVEYTGWVYDPDVVDESSVSVTAVELSALLDTDIPIEEDVREDVEEEFDGAIDADDLDLIVSVGNTEVLTGEFDTQEVTEAIDLETADSYGSFDLYESDDGDVVIAVTDGYVIESEASFLSNVDPRDELEAVIDTYEGEKEPLADENFEALTDELGSGMYVDTYVDADPDDDVEIVAEGLAADVDGERVTGKFVVIYVDEDDIDMDELETAAEEEEEIVDVSQSGRIVVAEIETDVEDSPIQ